MVKESYIEGMVEKYLMMIFKELILYLGFFEVLVSILKNYSVGFLRGKMCIFLGNVIRNGIIVVLFFILFLKGFEFFLFIMWNVFSILVFRI